MTAVLDDILARINGLNPEARASLVKETMAATGHMKFIPSPGAQTDAWFCPADMLLYGGSGGSGKSGLLLGLALTEHHRSLIMRRRYTDLGALTDEIIKFYGSRDGFSGGMRPKLRTSDNRLIEFGAAAHLGDEESWQGQAHDFLGVDEAVQFLEQQIRFLMGWVRSTDGNQRKRTVLASNPPVTSEGQWIIGMFRPWLDITHPKPAKHGELRWYVTDPDGKDFEVSGPEPYQFPGTDRALLPKSRTFIPGKLADNPFLVNTGYQAQLDSLPEPLRSAVRDGNFMAAKVDSEWQVIPTSWIKAAQERWSQNPPVGVPMCCMGVDVAQGGADNTTLAWRHDWWFAPLLSVPGKQTPYGTDVAGLVVANRRDQAVVVVDMGGGYGGGPYDHLKANGIEVIAYKGAEGTTRRTKDKQLGFYNKRAEAYWRFREALDPSQPNGSPVALPDDPELVSDLTAPLFEVDTRGIKITPKEELVSTLGRSPDKGDAVVMAWIGGPRGYTDMQEYSKHQAGGRLNRRLQVIMTGPKGRRY